MKASSIALHTRILAVIRESMNARGYPPSVREIGAAVGLKSPASVARQLALMEIRGLVERDATTCRGIRITEFGAAA